MDDRRAALSRSAIYRSGDADAGAGETDQLMALKVEVEQLRAALATRDLTWTAKTLIAATTGCSPEQAHELLVRQSQFEHRKLRDVALELVNRHESTARRAG
jgi:AmiR/NasT family two-component response regulator